MSIAPTSARGRRLTHPLSRDPSYANEVTRKGWDLPSPAPLNAINRLMLNSNHHLVDLLIFFSLFFIPPPLLPTSIHSFILSLISISFFFVFFFFFFFFFFFLFFRFWRPTEGHATRETETKTPSNIQMRHLRCSGCSGCSGCFQSTTADFFPQKIPSILLTILPHLLLLLLLLPPDAAVDLKQMK